MGCPQQVWSRGYTTLWPKRSKSSRVAIPTSGKKASMKQGMNSTMRICRSLIVLRPPSELAGEGRCRNQASRSPERALSVITLVLKRVGAQLVDQDPHVFRIIDRHGDKMDPAAGKSGFQRRRQTIGALHLPAALKAEGLGIGDEVGIAEGQAEIGKAVCCLFPADHPVGIVLHDQHDEIELETP